MSRWEIYELAEYLQLMDWTGRRLREDKRGAIAATLPDILQRLNFEPHEWQRLTQKFERRVSLLVSTRQAIQKHAATFGYRRIPSAFLSRALMT